MNQERFDELAQAFATNSISRRQVLKTLAASLLLGMLPTFGGGRHAEAQSVCTEVGSSCRENSECCSNICGRKRRRCKCKNLGQSCSEARNCCSGICQNGRCVCLQPGVGCADDEECCSGTCCNGFCCGAEQTCQNGECVCELLEPCGFGCCDPQIEECRVSGGTAACCSLEGVTCSGDTDCCSGECCRGVCCADGEACKDGRCKSRCRALGYPEEYSVFCPPTPEHPNGYCCPGPSNNCTYQCDHDQHLGDICRVFCS